MSTVPTTHIPQSMRNILVDEGEDEDTDQWNTLYCKLTSVSRKCYKKRRNSNFWKRLYVYVATEGCVECRHGNIAD